MCVFGGIIISPFAASLSSSMKLIGACVQGGLGVRGVLL